MRSPYHGIPSPYELQSNIVYFHDWRYVDTGQVSWQDEHGSVLPLWSHAPVPPLKLRSIDVPIGIRLISQSAVISQPVLSAGPDEILLNAGSVIHEYGKYRLWYESWPMSDYDGPGSERMGNRNLLCYAESSNGIDWNIPRVGQITSASRINAVFGGDAAGENGYHGGGVFADPSASPNERYKMLYLGRLSRREFADYQQGRADSVDPHQAHAPRVPALFGAVSADGIRWTRVREPMLVQNSDTHNICCYDANIGKYVAYGRSWYFDRRTIGRSTSDDFRQFTVPEEIFWPDASCPPHQVWYANAKTMMPGTLDYHLMFPVAWDLHTDQFTFGLATSPDGIVWGRVPGKLACEPGDDTTWYSGVVFPGCGMVDLPDYRMGILVCGAKVPHKHPRCAPLGKIGWATWPKGRLVALSAGEHGSFKLFPLKVRGRTVRLNYRVESGGFIKVESVDPTGAPISGRAFQQCEPLDCDHLDKTVTWNGNPDGGHQENAPIVLRFLMQKAELYSVSFR